MDCPVSRAKSDPVFVGGQIFDRVAKVRESGIECGRSFFDLRKIEFPAHKVNLQVRSAQLVEDRQVTAIHRLNQLPHNRFVFFEAQNWYTRKAPRNSALVAGFVIVGG